MTKVSWTPGQSYCGTALEAVEFALEQRNSDGFELRAFLFSWKEGDLTEWPEFKFESEQSYCPSAVRTRIGGKDHWDCNTCRAAWPVDRKEWTTCCVLTKEIKE